MRFTVTLAVVLLLAGCARLPSRPEVGALPGSAKSADDFRADDIACRQAAAEDAQTTAKRWRYDMIYLQCMDAKGNQIPVPGGSWQPYYVSLSPAAASPPSSAAPASPANLQSDK